MKNTLKKLMVFSMTGAIALSPMSAMAADQTTTSPAESSTTGSGSLEGYVDKNVFSVQLPTIIDNTIFNFTLDPQKLLKATGGANGDSAKDNYEANSTVFFKQADNKYKNTSQTLKAYNTGLNKVKVTLSATANNLGNLKLADSEAITGTDTSIYLALTQTGATGAEAKAAIKADTPATLTGTLDGVDEKNFETTYDASAPGHYKFAVKPDVLAKVGTADGDVIFKSVGFGLKGAANTDSTVDWSTIDTTTTQPSVDVKWTLSDANITGPDVASTATFTKGTALEIPVDLGKADLAAKKVTVTTTSVDTTGETTGTYANNTSVTYANGKITIAGTAWAKATAASTRYIKVVFNDKAKTTKYIAVTINNA